MANFLVFLVAGLTAGAVYALAGVGLVLTYRTSGIFNFAHGALATVSAYLFYTLHVTHEMPWVPATLISVLVAGPVMGLVMEAIARRLQLVPLAMRVAATVGVLLAVASAATLIYGTTQVREVPVFLSSASFHFGGTIVQWSDAITLIFGIVATTGLWLVLRFARVGIAMRAVVDNRDLLDTAGVSPTMVQRSAWIIGATFAASSGVLFSTLLPLDPIQLTMLVVAAFGASAIGGFRSLPMTFAGGLLIGVLASLATGYITTPSLAGLSPSMPFVALFAVLLVFPKSKLPRTQRSLLAIGPNWSAPPLLSVSAGTAVLVLLALVPSFAGLHLTDWTSALAMVILFLSLTLLVRTSGQVSLCHITFAAIGAAGFSHLAVDHHLPWLIALLVASLVAVPVGAVLAIPAIRLGGVYLALATFGLGILVQYMFYTQPYMFGATGAGLPEPRPHLSWVNLDSDTGFYYVVLAFTLCCVILLVAINRSRLGRLLRGVSEAPVALQTSGAAINITRVLVFCISAFLAALGGALMAISQGVASTPSYPPIQSLTLLTVVAIIAVGAPWNAILAGGLLVLVPSYFTGADVATYLQLVFGLSAAFGVFLPESAQHLPSAFTRRVDRWFGVSRVGSALAVTTPSAVGPIRSLTPVPQAAGPVALEICGLRVSFGGVRAVQDLTMTARTGEITGLIGPNGAGKTTTFNACSGLVRSSGSIQLTDRTISNMRPARRARTGLGRTFQQMQLFDALSVRDNVALGAEARYAHNNPLAHFLALPAQRRSTARRTARALDICGIADLADARVSNLSTGQRRLVDLARCMAGEHRVLLLDEPSSGLDGAETARFAETLRRVVSEDGVAVVLVEHDLSLVLDICSTIYVMDFGQLLFAGTPAEVTASPIVQAAYLGDSESLDRQVDLAGGLAEVAQ